MRPKYAPATANRVVILLRYMFNLARKWHIPGAENNPTAGVQLFEANNARERYLTAEETKRLVSVLTGSDNTQLKYIVPLLLLMGCRKRELLDAKWQDFDLDRRQWRIPMTKSGKARHVPVSDATVTGWCPACGNTKNIRCTQILARIYAILECILYCAMWNRGLLELQCDINYDRSKKMAATAFVRARIDEGLKDEAVAVLADMGLTVSDVVRIVLTKVAKEKALPFEMRIPNKLTIDTISKSERGEDVHQAKDAADLFKQLGI